MRSGSIDLRRDPPSVLLVDDVEANLIALEAVLSDLPCTLVRARGGNDALKLLLKRRYAVMLLDVQMPDIDGWEVLASIRADRSLDPIPVVMCTVRAGAADRARGYGHGADAYEAKPFDLDQLLGTVRRLAHMDVEHLLERRAALWTEAQA